MEDLQVGNVAKCQQGILGVICKIREGICYGWTLDGDKWQSQRPTLVADSSDTYYAQQEKKPDDPCTD